MLHGAQAVRHRLTIGASADDALLGQWREVYGRMLLRLDLEPTPGVPLHFHADMQAWPGFAFSNVTTSGMRATRSADLAADGRDDIGLVAIVAGTAVVDHSGRQVDLTAGQAVLLRSSEPGHVWFPSSTCYVNLAMPAKCLEPLVPELDALGMVAVPAHSIPLRLALRYASLLLEDEDDLVEAGMHQIVASHFRDLAVAMMGGTGEMAANTIHGVRAARLKTIKADIGDNLTCHDLSVTAIAARHGITPRYIGKLFEAEGTTFSQYVLNERLGYAYRMLADTRFARHSISTIAGDAGFGDISHFNRTFRHRYGATPSEVRAES